MGYFIKDPFIDLHGFARHSLQNKLCSCLAFLPSFSSVTIQSSPMPIRQWSDCLSDSIISLGKTAVKFSDFKLLVLLTTSFRWYYHPSGKVINISPTVLRVKIFLRNFLLFFNHVLDFKNMDNIL